MTSFLNPYHFVPLSEKVHGLPLADFQSLKEKVDSPRANHLRHDRYITELNNAGSANNSGHFSGRLICSLKAVGPFVVGGSGGREREMKDGSAVVPPFEIISGEPAIPASTLRGLISSLAEALSNSTLRVLDNRHYSVRSQIRRLEHHRPMIGMVVGEVGQRHIRPLTFPAMRAPRGSGPKETYPVPTSIQCLADVLVFPCYLDQYNPDGGFLESLQADVKSGAISWDTIRRSFWSLPCSPVEKRSTNITAASGAFRRGSRTPDYVLGVNRSASAARPVVLNDDEAVKDCNRGILRILGRHNSYRENHFPPDKRHELFIPVPDLSYFTHGKRNGRGRCFDLPAEEVLVNFENLARQATINSENAEGAELPFELAGQPRRGKAVEASHDRRIPTIQLHDGDLVYFRVEGNGQEELPTVKSVAIASVWREDAGLTYDYFNQVNPDLVPFDEQPPDSSSGKRTELTTAEQMFGFVSEVIASNENRLQPVGGTASNPIRGLASRIRFSDARLNESLSSHIRAGGHYQPQVRLKILSSPKAPSPSLYFCRKNRSSVSKLDLAEPTQKRRDVLPMGRKFYLHHPKSEFLKERNPPWQTQDSQNNQNQKVWVTPVRPGAAFLFHLDFYNLTASELSVLCRALMPYDDFHHKIGMGKPLGLGTVKLQPVGLFLTDRKKRYESDDIFSGDVRRYHSRAIYSESEWEKVSGLYPWENASGIPGDAMSFQQRCSHFSPESAIAQAVKLLGSVPEAVVEGVRIHYPLVSEAVVATPQEQEQKHFEWFVANEASDTPEYLKPVDANTKSLSELNSHRRRRSN
jgi:hypothetical protein